MRIKISIIVDKLPIIYRHRLVSLIKEALKRSDEDYKNFLYNGKITKPFSFNLVFPKEKQIKKEIIQIDNKFKIEDIVFYFNNQVLNLYISSTDYRFIISLVNGLKKIKRFNFSFDNNFFINGEKIHFQIKSLSVLNEKPIKSETVVFKTNSPIIIEDKKDNPIVFDNEKFEYYLNEITYRILKSPHIKGKGLEKPLKFEPIKMKKQVIKHTLKEFREKTGKPIMFLTGSSGIFKLSGHPKDLEILYKIGIGNRTGQGFGMVDTVQR